MRVYQTRDDGVFVGLAEADESPLEPGVFLLPAGCIAVEPPSFSAGQLARWGGSGWVIEDVPEPEPEPGPEPEPEPTEPPPLTKLAKATLWRRCTDEEAEILSFVLSQAPFRLRLIFEAAQYLDTTDSDYEPLRAGVVAALGEARAVTLLHPEF